MPHESTVAHEQRFVMETPMISRSRTFFDVMEQTEDVVNGRHSPPVSVLDKNLYKFIQFGITYIFYLKLNPYKFINLCD